MYRRRQDTIRRRRFSLYWESPSIFYQKCLFHQIKLFALLQYWLMLACMTWLLCAQDGIRVWWCVTFFQCTSILSLICISSNNQKKNLHCTPQRIGHRTTNGRSDALLRDLPDGEGKHAASDASHSHILGSTFQPNIVHWIIYWSHIRSQSHTYTVIHGRGSRGTRSQNLRKQLCTGSSRSCSLIPQMRW